MSIPASRIVLINPSAIGTGGNPLAMNTMLIVDGPQRTIGVQQNGSAAEVGARYGLLFVKILQHLSAIRPV